MQLDTENVPPERMLTIVAEDAEQVEQLKGLLNNKHFRNVMLACWNIYKAKGNDYTRGKGDEDRLDNFKQCAALFDIPLRKAWAVYFYKQVSVIWRYVRTGVVESEPVESRCHDVINYTVLLLLALAEERAELAVTKPTLLP